MASALAIEPQVDPAAANRPCLRVSFSRFPGVPAREREWWFEPEFPGVYRLSSVNGLRPPYFWQGPSGDGMSEWLISGRAFIHEDRSWLVRLASGPKPVQLHETQLTVVQGTWAPAMTGQLAVRTSDGYAGAWMANGRSILMRGLITGPDRRTTQEVTLRFAKWR